MIQLIGIKHDVKVEIRERLSIIQKRCETALEQLLNLCDEAVIVSTCNRTEIYFNSQQGGERLIENIFECLGWEYQYRPYTFYLSEREAVNHLYEVVCGFDSMLLGEDQILGQIKEAYETSRTVKAVGSDLMRLFQMAIACGKEFRYKSQLYKIPLSLASMVVKQAAKREMKRFMILGFGEIGQLVSKYILEEEFDRLYIAVRNLDVMDISDNRVKAICFQEKQKYLNDVDCIIACTSAPHVVIRPEDLPDKKMLIFDMAVPRDVAVSVGKLSHVELYDTDQIGKIQDENHQKRKEVMEKYRYMINLYVREFEQWQKLKELSPHIQKIKVCGDKIYQQRYRTFQNKQQAKDNEKLAQMLLKSTSNAYVNKAINVLKEEHLKGRGEECLRILEKIFQA